MVWFSLGVILLISSGSSAQLAEEENCDIQQLDVCVAKVPPTRIGLPRNKEELDAHCGAYNIGVNCMFEWMHRCLPNDSQKLLNKMIGGARVVMRFLCNETGVRQDYLKETRCWYRVSSDWSQCMKGASVEVQEIGDRSHQQLSYASKSKELCCARDEFLNCVAQVTRVCSATASALLRRLAFVIAQDFGASECPPPPIAYCTAPPPLAATPILIALYNAFFYFTRF